MPRDYDDDYEDDHDDRDDDRGRGGDDETGIEVRTWVFPLYWTLYLAKPVVAIDGKKDAVGWGTFFFPAKPGYHIVEVWTPFLFFQQYMKGSERVRVREGRVVRLCYEIKPFNFTPLRVEGDTRRGRDSRDVRDL